MTPPARYFCPEMYRKRSDEAFDEMIDEVLHTVVSSLTKIGVGMVSRFPLDYMHFVCLGVVRRLILLWMCVPLNCRGSVSWHE